MIDKNALLLCCQSTFSCPAEYTACCNITAYKEVEVLLLNANSVYIDYLLSHCTDNSFVLLQK